MALLDIIKNEIREEGPISVARYMELALGHPEHGYYIKRDPFGERGDFITAPEICQIFGEMIGLWSAELWHQMGAGPVQIVEMGPGRGTLMADFLRATKHVDEFHAHMTIHFVETSPHLQDAQFHAVHELHDRFEWHSTIEDVPEAPSIFIANEFFDALPIRQHMQTDSGMKERLVGLDDEDKLVFVLEAGGLSLAKGESKIAEGTVMESCPVGKQIMAELSRRVKQHGGGALIIDYGYLGEAHQDTLQALKNHAFHNVLSEPGEADVTAHVDFATLLEVAEGQGVGFHGPIEQGKLLSRLGAELRANMLIQHASPDQQEQLVSGLRRLIDPNQMGELFKAIAITQHSGIVPAGFEKDAESYDVSVPPSDESE